MGVRQLLVENVTMRWFDTGETLGDPPLTTQLNAADSATTFSLIGVANGEALVTESVTGFSLSPTQIETPDYVSLQVGKIPGSVTVDDASMEFYLSDTPVDNFIYNNLPVGQTGNIVICPSPAGVGATAIGDVAQTWPATVQSKNIKFTGSNEAAKWVLNLALGIPTVDQTLAA